MMYHSLEIVGGGGRNHAHKMTSARQVLDLVLGETFAIVSNSVDVEMIIIAIGNRNPVVHQEASSLRVFAQVEDVKTFVCWHEFDYTVIRENMEHTVPIMAIVGDVKIF
jgi:hypothetical protein